MFREKHPENLTIDGVNFVARVLCVGNGVDDVERARPSSLSLTLAPDYGRADLIIAISRPAVRDRMLS